MKSWTAAVVMVAAVIAAPTAAAGPSAAAAGDDSTGWTSFYDTGQLQDSGWASCPDPIGVSIDTSKFSADESSRIAQALSQVVQLWTQAGGLTFTFAGIIPMDYDTATGVLTPRDGLDRTRHIYIGYVRDADSPQFNERVVGLGAPTTVNTTNRELTAGAVTFQREYATKASVPELVALIGHEFGHALGLGHSTSTKDVMYPIVRRTKNLGPGDLAGLQALARPCMAAIPSRDYPLPG